MRRCKEYDSLLAMALESVVLIKQFQMCVHSAFNYERDVPEPVKNIIKKRLINKKGMKVAKC